VVDRLLVSLSKEQLMPYRLGNGKISIGKASAGLGLSFPTVKRECARLDIPTANMNVTEHYVVEKLSKLLGGVEYKSEWTSFKFKNPVTGARLRFDAYFPSLNLLVEYQGAQHWKFIPVYFKSENVFEKLKARDALKVVLVKLANIPLLIIREDEPWQDEDHLRKRLEEIGVLPSHEHHDLSESGQG
jgi:hypothetical protein